MPIYPAILNRGILKAIFTIYNLGIYQTLLIQSDFWGYRDALEKIRVKEKHQDLKLQKHIKN